MINNCYHLLHMPESLMGWTCKLEIFFHLYMFCSKGTCKVTTSSYTIFNGNDLYIAICRQILPMDPFPFMNQTYPLILKEKR